MKIALIQTYYSEDINQRLSDLIQKAAKKAELIILQELHQSPYFCITEDPKNFKYAQNLEQDLNFWSWIAKINNIVLVTSLFEKRAEGLYHNTAFVFEKDGSIAGKYRKMHIPDDPAYYEKFYFTEGDLGFNPIQTSVGNLGILICWDQWFPEAARLMAMAGADLLIYPTAIGFLEEEPLEEQLLQLHRWFTIQKSHAIANGIPVVTVNRIGFEQDPSQNFRGIKFWGNSFIINAKGIEVARASESQETILYADLNKNNIGEIREMWPFFRDRRMEDYKDLLKRWRD